MLKLLKFFFRKIFHKKEVTSDRRVSFVLVRESSNPILFPDFGSSWQNLAVYNQAAIYLGGRVHFIYRAIGHDYVSVLGYASSKDGVHVDERLGEPVFAISEELTTEGNVNLKETKVPYPYSSGINRCGAEDPRLTRVEETIYMTYTVYDGWNAPGVGLSSISVDDFLNKKWNWSEPLLISEPKKIQKNWVIFPEKIKGKYAILHCVNPHVEINYLDDLDFKNRKFISSGYCKGGRKGHWDSWVRGVAAPPMRTERGWLVLYHGMDIDTGDKYKLGAMVLDFEDPKKILYRSAYPLLEPSARYEMEGLKPGVIYCCGAVIKDGELFVYYGAADTVICVAKGKLSEMLDSLEKV